MATNVANVKHRLYDVETQPVNKPDAQRSAIKMNLLNQSQWPPLPNGTTVKPDKVQEALEDKDALKKDLNRFRNSLYDFEIQSNALKIFSDTPKGGKALKKVEEMFNLKGHEMRIENVTITCSKERDGTKPVQMLIFSDSLPVGPVNLHFYWYKKDGRCSLRIVKASGASMDHVKIMFEKVCFLMDGFIDGYISEGELQTYTISLPRDSSEKCNSCGKTLLTKNGLKRHLCVPQANFDILHKCSQCQETFGDQSELEKHISQLHKSDKISCQKCSENFISFEDLKLHWDKLHEIPPLKKDKNSSQSIQFSFKNIDIDQHTLEERIIEDAVETGQINFTPTIHDPNSTNELSLENVLKKEYPGYIVQDVEGDGACFTRSGSAVTLKTQVFHPLLSKSIDRYITVDNWDIFKISIDWDKYKRRVPGQEIRFRCEKQFRTFCQSEKSIHMWREFPDAVALCEIFGIGIDILVVENGIVNKAKQIKIDPKPNTPPRFRIQQKLKIKRITLVNFDDVHFKAIVNPNETENAKTINNIVEELTNYVCQNKAKSVTFSNDTKPGQTNETIPDSMNDRVAAMERRMHEMQNQLTKSENNFEILAEKNRENDLEIKSLKAQINFLHEKYGNNYSKETSSQESVMEWNDVSQEASDLHQAQVLRQQKLHGFQRISPQVSPVKQKREIYPCTDCGKEFDTKTNFEKHKERNHSIPLDKLDKTTVAESIPSSSASDDSTKNTRIPLVTLDLSKNDTLPGNPAVKDKLQNIRGRRQYNCHDCLFEGNSSKNLLRHSRESGHRNVDDLTERCFACDEKLANFDELMQHRRYKHLDSINSCRFFREGNCRFQSNCWYRHDSPRAEISSNAANNNQSNFQLPRNQVPPDQVSQLCVLVKDLLSVWQSKEESKQKRTQGQ